MRADGLVLRFKWSGEPYSTEGRGFLVRLHEGGGSDHTLTRREPSHADVRGRYLDQDAYVLKIAGDDGGSLSDKNRHV
jgi:hypothetical protein